MTTKLWIIGRLLLAALVGLLAFVSGVWGALALWYRLPGNAALRAFVSVAWAMVVMVLAAWAISGRSWVPVGVYALALVLLLGWWRSIVPSNDRVWADDVSRMPTGTVDGNRVTLIAVRDFTWRTEADYDVRWETRDYDLKRLVSADAVISFWDLTSIAHAMISFGFADGGHVVFSVEVRRGRGQAWSAIGGFFKQYETILVAAEERDIIRVRTNVRGEDDYLYPLRLDRATLRELFVAYVNAANRLAGQPRFYNTVTSNCTTIVYRMARRIDPGLPWDPRLLLTGYLPSYLYEIGALNRSVPLAELRRRGRITQRARDTRPGDDFSRAIRS